MSSPIDPGSPHRNSHQSDHVPIGRIAEALIRDSTVNNTKIAYDRVVFEWKGYCDHVSQHSDRDSGPETLFGSSYLVTSEKLLDFLLYQVCRSRQRVGGLSGESGRRGFNHEEYDKLKVDYQDHYNVWQTNDNYRMPDPGDGGIGVSAMIQYRAALKGLYEQQRQQDHTLGSWGSVCSYHAKRLFRLVSHRKARMNRENFREKTQHEFSGYHAMDQYENIENEFWKGTFHSSMKSAFPYMRYRMLFLFTTAGVLRNESLMKAELSDFQGLTVRKETDIDPIYVMITVLKEGRFFLREKWRFYL